MQLHTERTSNCRTTENPAYAFRIDMNVIPQVDVFLDNGYSKEEMKMHNETQKFMVMILLRFLPLRCVFLFPADIAKVQMWNVNYLFY